MKMSNFERKYWVSSRDLYWENSSDKRKRFIVVLIHTYCKILPRVREEEPLWAVVIADAK